VLATAKLSLAVARAAAAGAKIAACAEGGRTDQLVNVVPPAMLASLMTGAGGDGLAPTGTFAGGGA
jgi:hypothetical protein